MKINKRYIICADIEYDNYKKKIMKEIFKHLDIIFSLFNEEFNDNVTKIFILLKKNKLEKHLHNKLMKLYELIFYINNIKIIDQKEYLLIILKIINLDIDSIVNEFSSYKFTSLLNLSYIVDNINNIKNLITQKNFLIAKIFLLKKHINTNNEQKIIKKISNILSKDFFNYYN